MGYTSLHSEKEGATQASGEKQESVTCDGWTGKAGAYSKIYDELFSSHGEREGEARRALLAEGVTQAPVIDNHHIDAIITIKRILW
jgi:hypothetical protein